MKYFFPARLDLLRPDAADVVIAHKCGRPMGVAEKTERGVLIGETGDRIEIVEDVAPLCRGIEGGVDDGEIAHLSRVAQFAQPFLVSSVRVVRASS